MDMLQVLVKISEFKSSTTSKKYVNRISQCYIFSSVQFSTQSCPTLCEPTNSSTPAAASLSITNSQSPPKPIPIRLMMSPNHLILCQPDLKDRLCTASHQAKDTIKWEYLMVTVFGTGYCDYTFYYYDTSLTFWTVLIMVNEFLSLNGPLYNNYYCILEAFKKIKVI